jgi:hypothetical protein
MKKLMGTMLLCAASLASGLAFGHGTPVANHGGVVMAVGELWLELVVRGDAVELYLEDDGEAMSSAGIGGKLTVPGKPELVLAPAGGNKLSATSAGPLPKGAKVSAVLLLADKKTKVATTFTLK